MIRVSRLGAAAAALLVAAPAAAGAETVQSIRYAAYPVSGRTPAEIYRNILKRGPKVNGAKAIAATATDAVQSNTLESGPAACRVVDHRMSFQFTVQLPRHTGLSVLSREDRRLWQQFSVFLKAHEMQHVKLWLGCAADFERQIESIRAASCDTVKATADKVWRRMKANCDAKQASFDKEQRSELLAQPFMQKVIGNR